MEWTIQDLGAFGEFVGAFAVVATLGYLAVQIRQNSKMMKASLDQGERSTLHHVTDGFKDFTGRIAESDKLSSIITRGQNSYSSLSDEERLRFDFIYLSLLNTLESWYLDSDHDILTMSAEVQGGNLRDAILYYCDNPGFREVWNTAKPMFPELSSTMDQVLDPAGAGDRGA